MAQSHLITWIPIDEQDPPSRLVLASTRDAVHILWYSKGPEKMNDPHWMDNLGKRFQLGEVVAWAELPTPFMAWE
jgi:hypothetical protein